MLSVWEGEGGGGGGWFYLKLIRYGRRKEKRRGGEYLQVILKESKITRLILKTKNSQRSGPTKGKNNLCCQRVSHSCSND